MTISEYKTAWNAAHPDRRAEHSRRHRQKLQADPERREMRNAIARIRRAARIATDEAFRGKEHERRKGRRATVEKWANANVAAIRIRAANEGVAFDLTKEWLLTAIPPECPIFRRPFVFGPRSPLNASVDRIIPDGGYVTNNVCIISQEANLIKRRCTDPTIFRRMSEWLEMKIAQRRGDESRENSHA